MVAHDPAERRLPRQAPTDNTIRRKLVLVAMFALRVAYGGFVLAGIPSRPILERTILMANFTVSIHGLMVIYFFMGVSTGIPGLPITADRLILVTLAVSVATLFLNAACLILVAS